MEKRKRQHGKAVSLILALTLALSLSVPALAADYKELTLPIAGGDSIVFEAAAAETKTVTTYFVLDEDHRTENVAEDAEFITLKPGSTVKGGMMGYAYYLDDGKYCLVDAAIFDLMEGVVDDWFKRVDDYTGNPICMYEVDGKRDNGDPMSFFFVLGESAEPARKPVVQPTAQNLTVNGEKKNTEIYNIDGSNFFKLRDVAALLNGTDAQFSVDYDAASNAIVVKTGTAYTSVGGELETGTDKSASAVVSTQKVKIDGSYVYLTAYNIGGNNFFKLRELGEKLYFAVDWDAASSTIVVTCN